MDRERYQAFTEALRNRVAGEHRVLGLVAVGSMSGAPAPDAFSDHDFFLVVSPGSQEAFRARLDWLPDPGEIVLSFRETEHGLKVLYRNAHLLEFAVFEPGELALARVNRYRVLLDRADLESRMKAVREATGVRVGAEAPSTEVLLGQFLTQLVVGVGRHRRGERLAALARVKGQAFLELVRLAKRLLPAEVPEAVDNLDPLRRIEVSHPAIAEELQRALSLDLEAAAGAMLALVESRLVPELEAPPRAALAAVAEFVRSPRA